MIIMDFVTAFGLFLICEEAFLKTMLYWYELGYWVDGAFLLADDWESFDVCRGNRIFNPGFFQVLR
jgi:hypothetical protein